MAAVFRESRFPHASSVNEPRAVYMIAAGSREAPRRSSHMSSCQLYAHEVMQGQEAASDLPSWETAFFTERDSTTCIQGIIAAGDFAWLQSPVAVHLENGSRMGGDCTRLGKVVLLLVRLMPRIPRLHAVSLRQRGPAHGSNWRLPSRLPRTGPAGTAITNRTR